jgi:Histidine kinase
MAHLPPSPVHPLPTVSAANPTSGPASALQRIIDCWPKLLGHGWKVAVLCIAIATALWLAQLGSRYDVQLVYSLAIGGLSWLSVDLGRFVIDPTSPFGFPRGWRAVALIVGGCAFGQVVGTLLGDSYSGFSSFGFFLTQPWQFVRFAAIMTVVGIVVSYFFYASGKSHYLISELQATQRQAAQAQLKLLQSQLDPHMLFNTLANLRSLIATDPERATRMLDQLGDYLRSTLTASRATEHPLQAEFDRLRDYLGLMAVRMGPRLRYTLALPPALAQASVPALLLQSLVENAIVHGLEPQLAGGTVHISARADGNTLVLQVTDDGAGFDAAHTTEGFGIGQVRERLATCYGTEATIDLIAACAVKTWTSGQNSLKNMPASTVDNSSSLHEANASLSAAHTETAHGCTVTLRIPLTASVALPLHTNAQPCSPVP